MNFDTRKILSNLIGWNTKRKILVIESDDWGSIRMPSLYDYNSMAKKGINLIGGDARRYNENDSLATPNDLSGLFDILTKFKDKENNHPVFSAICLVANPDFDKIEESGFTRYFYEPITTTLERTPGRENSFKLWKEGITNRLFIPEFHGREHLNVQVWLKQLRLGDKDTFIAFKHRCWGINNVHPFNVSYQAAFDLFEPSEINYHHEVIENGLALFESLFGYKASQIVPPNGPFNNSLEETAAKNGIRYITTAKIQHEPLGYGKTRKIFHYLGQKNKNSQRYLTRNCSFEPSKIGRDWINTCLSEIETAFLMCKPAIVSSHRVNYIGALNPSNRDKGLKDLEQLITIIIKRWPDVEFMTSVELGNIIQGKKETPD